MTSRQRALFYSLFLTLMMAGVTVYIFAIKNKPQIQKYNIFNPADVLGLEWQLSDQAFKFEKSLTSAAWTPQVDANRINEKLILLSTMKLQPLNPLSYDLQDGIKLTVKFNNQSEWMGVFVQDTFLWLSGNFANQGTILNASQIEIFHEGRYAFLPLYWEWCDANLRKLTYEYDEEAFEISRHQNQWELKSLSGSSKLVDSAWLQSWLDTSCAVTVRAWVDLDFASPGLDDGAISIERKDGSRSEISIRGTLFQISDEQALISPDLNKKLSELSEAP